MAGKKPFEQFTGLTLEQWRSDVSNITWAQQEPRFKMMLSVLLNESTTAIKTAAGCSEGRAFGRVEGYNMALDALRSLGQRPERRAKEPDATFDEPPAGALKVNEPFD